MPYLPCLFLAPLDLLARPSALWLARPQDKRISSLKLFSSQRPVTTEPETVSDHSYAELSGV
jgi:hypothetical protein